MSFLELLYRKAFKMDLSNLPERDRLEIKKHFDNEKNNPKPLILSDEAKQRLVDEINRIQLTK